MDVRIGVQNAARELNVDTELGRDEVVASLQEALASDGLLSVSDRQGGSVVVPADKIAYVQFGSDASRTVGFGA